MGSYKSKEDDIARISISIFVMNFPKTFLAKDLFHTCKKYGHVVDSFIPMKRSKVGKRFGFVRFINVFNNERLVNNLCTIWNNRLKLHANIARFQRNNGNVKNPAPTNGGEGKNVNTQGQVKVNVSKEPCNSYVEALKGQSQSYFKATESSPLLVLDDECLASKDLTKGLFGRVKVFASLANLKMALHNEGFADIKVQYLGELWVFMEFASLDSIKLFRDNRLCIHSKIMRSINEDFKIIFCGKVYWIRAKETPGWVLDFADDSDDEEQNGDEGNEEGQNNLNTVSNDHVSDEEEIPKIVFEDTGDKHCNVVEEHTHQRSEISNDPFNLYPLLKQKRRNDMNGTNSMNILKYPHGFTPNASHFKKSEVPRTGGPILNLLDKVVKVGQVMGYKIDGCMANMEDIIQSQREDEETKMENMELSCVRRVWGNVNFEYVHSDSVGNSGGILCAWDPNVFCKHNVTISDYFIMVRGVWHQSGKELLIIVVYAPHDLSEKKVLWEYLVHVISKWNGEVVLIGDFNEVQYKTDMFGSVFDARGANMFNSFITDAGIVEVHLGGCAFTWCHKSATKMSKLDRFLVSESLLSLCPNLNDVTLKRYLLDHRPILLHESNVDYGLTSFRFFHHWMEIEGFCKFVEDVWKGYSCDESNALKRMTEKLKYLKIRIKEWIRLNRICVKSGRAKLIKDLADVDAIIDSGNGNEEVVNKRMGVINDLHNVDNLHSVEMAQKAKIRWAIEGDENSSYFHGLINKKRSILNIRGIMEEGRWIDDPKNVKMEFYSHFSQHSGRPDGRLVTVHTRYPNVLTLEQHMELESIVSNEEIKRAIWDCGTDKASGPDGFTFGFYRSKIMGINIDNNKVIAAVRKLGCLILKPHFSYLGSIVGGSMSRVLAWKEVVDRVKNRLFKWKMKTLSIGGRLTLLKSVLGSMSIYHMSIFKAPMSVLHMLESIRSHFFNGQALNSKKSSWVSWKKVLASKEKGGLGVSNLSLMLKWVWRFFTQANSLWVRVVKAIHGDDEKIGATIKTGTKSCWLNIVHEIDVLRRKENNKLVTVGTKLTQQSLDCSFRRVPRGGIELEQFINLKALVQNVILDPMEDRWKWDLESSGDFSVASIRKRIDGITLLEVNSKSRWIKYVPIKVNVHAWKVKNDALPSRFNILRRGIVINSIMCDICHNWVETVTHLFFSCCLVREVTRLICRWWDMPFEEFVSYEDWLEWILRLRLPAKNKMMFEGVFYVLWWHVWAFRNKLLFDVKDLVNTGFLMMLFLCRFIGVVIDVKRYLVGSIG
uniref:RNA-directed DNA polymerase, eukaryota, reverse transcriptase zinc-binding domain protein n=1 Tax=Tanacetum cinerariifolium TaxID=118510 RepID=A0A6L2JH47_TANCI|nr:RNA-directed DNA polymerase, eukaryota, reverse transcriptase zinc-binding domain protein [Tanacetum cinerariifolium]